MKAPGSEVPLHFDKKYKSGDAVQRRPLLFDKKYKTGDTL